MTKIMKINLIIICVLLLFMSCFISIGYAELTEDLYIMGTGEWVEPQAVRIIDLGVSKATNVTGDTFVTKAGHVVFQYSNCTLNRQTNASNPGGLITVTVTVKNSSGVGQYFIEHTTTPALSRDCVVTVSGIESGELIPYKGIKTFTITIQNTNKRSTVNLNELESMLHFSPYFDESFTENASKSLAEIFENVLAGKGPDGNGGSITYKGREVIASQIVQTLSNTMENVDTGGYIGNVGNASQDQKDLISAIFGENLTMEIGNQNYSVSILIKNQQIDGKGENDMVMYITADQLAIGGGRWSNNAWRDLNIVPVYGIVFINNGRNGYTTCEHLFAGEAPVCNFGGSFGEGNVGNFNTNLWNSTEYEDLTDKSGGQITQSYITTNGELDEAYQRYAKENP